MKDIGWAVVLVICLGVWWLLPASEEPPTRDEVIDIAGDAMGDTEARVSELERRIDALEESHERLLDVLVTWSDR